MQDGVEQDRMVVIRLVPPHFGIVEPLAVLDRHPVQERFFRVFVGLPAFDQHDVAVVVVGQAVRPEFVDEVIRL